MSAAMIRPVLGVLEGDSERASASAAEGVQGD